MIRFPNPGSDIPSFIRVFQTLYTYLSDKAWFSLDDMSATLTNMNLAASSGYVGEQALALSTREDRSRDPLYNQSKMYAELFRTLGWMVSDDPEAALRFRFTLLGDHAAAADIDPKAIFEESVLGINYPNRILAIKGTEASRVFSAILRAATRLDGCICRDEIILGILNRSDVDDGAMDDITTYIRGLRGSAARLERAMNETSARIEIQVNTMRNYTRFPLALMQFCEWFDRIPTKRFYPDSRPTIMFQLTAYGQKRAEKLDRSIDIRMSYLETKPTEQQKAFIRLGFYSMLQRANFDISPAIAQVAADQIFLRREIADKSVVFSPYQTVRPEVADNALGITQEARTVGGAERTLTPAAFVAEAVVRQTTTIRLRQIASCDTVVITGSPIEWQIAAHIKNGRTNKQIAAALFKEYRLATKEVFYPLIADLFTIVGFKCHYSRSGVNYERWDAIAADVAYTIPIEIKSPTEEEYISVKAVRQALENKVILLSRRSYPTDWDTVTLAVGYYPPNERAEVSRLIADMKDTFGVRIGIIDLQSLLTIASESVRNGGSHVSEIRQMEGLISVESI
jgi:hypothetical protein